MPTHWTAVTPSPDGERVAIDPYLTWAKRTGFCHIRPLCQEEMIPLFLELAPDMTAAEFAAGAWRKNNGRSNGWRSWLRISNLYTRPAAGLADTHFCTAAVTSAFFDHLRRDGGLQSAIKRIQFGLPLVPLCQDNVAAATRPGNTTTPHAAEPRTTPSVVTAIIDDGLAVAHERFRRSDGSTRVEYFWDQDGPPTSAPTIDYGREYLAEDITAAMEANRHAGMVDEDAVYRALGVEDYTTPHHKALGRCSAHGTHVMDLACGFAPAHPHADERSIIAVQLPGRTTRDTSGAYLWPQVYDGLRYIIDRADALAAASGRDALPIVVNLSYGMIAGPHDGSSPLERAIDELTVQRREVAPFEVVIPSGNHYLARCHAQVTLRTGDRQSFAWRILPDDRTPNFLEVWLPCADATGSRKVKVRVATPTGDLSPSIAEGGHYTWRPGGGVLCDVLYTASPAGGDRPLIHIAVAPTATLDPNQAIAPCGKWTVLVENVGPEACIEAWIQRNDTPYGWPVLGRQSRFDDPNYVLYEPSGRIREDDDAASYVKRAGSINALATGRQIPVIGGFRRSDYAASDYSGAGPVVAPAGKTPWRSGPDATAITDDTVALPGIIAAGTRSGSVCAMNGTSVAAPQVTRLLATWMAEGRPSDRAAVQAFAKRRDPDPGHRLPATRGGAGRIETPSSVPRWTRWPKLG